MYYSIREWMSKRREEIRPWGTFAKTSNFEPPQNLPKWSKRLYKNIEHFQSNYVSIIKFLKNHSFTRRKVLVKYMTPAFVNLKQKLKVKQHFIIWIFWRRWIMFKYFVLGLCLSYPVYLLPDNIPISSGRNGSFRRCWLLCITQAGKTFIQEI